MTDFASRLYESLTPVPTGVPNVDASAYLDEMPSGDELAAFRRRTKGHIETVREKLQRIANGLRRCQIHGHGYDESHMEWVDAFQDAIVRRGEDHDLSKLQPPEAPIFAQIEARLQDLTYGSKEYEEALDDLGPALDHHYASNSHHPEFYDEGIAGMNLLDVAEMCCDWCAAIERHEDGHVIQSVNKNRKRFSIPDRTAGVLTTTLFWLDGQPIARGVRHERTIAGLIWWFCRRAEKMRDGERFSMEWGGATIGGTLLHKVADNTAGCFGFDAHK